uniref:Uncharacterized protein n=1 Tax=Aegilops tauschii subsp. strangulata TaxID=200361 RepID=A0A453KXX8_AEGTS
MAGVDMISAGPKLQCDQLITASCTFLPLLC